MGEGQADMVKAWGHAAMTWALSHSLGPLPVWGCQVELLKKKCFSILSDNNPYELAPLGFGPTKQAIFLGQINLLFSRG